MIFFLGMVISNVVLLGCFAFLSRHSRWKWIPVAFVSLQLAGLLWFLGERTLDFAWQLPKAAVSALYVWHFLGLGIFVPLVGLVIAGLLSVWGRNRFRCWRSRTPRESSPSVEKQALTRRQFLGTTIALAPPLFTVGVTGIALKQLEHFRVRRLTLPLPGLPRDLDGVTIAHLSDMHVGPFTSGRVLREMVRVTNDLRSDLVLLTGDLINSELADLPEAIATLKAMEGRFGVWTIEGNHDLIEDGREFRRRMKDSGINFLLDEQAVITVRGHPVQLLGLPWVRGGGEDYDTLLSESTRRLLQQWQPDAFPVFLAHHPHAFDAAAEAGIPLTLSGHTHGGQLMLNEETGFGPALFRYWSGIYHQGQSQMVVSNGTGNWFPIRINAPAEIIHITLRSA